MYYCIRFSAELQMELYTVCSYVHISTYPFVLCINTNLQLTCMINSFETFPYSFSATQTYFPVSVNVMSAVNVMMLLLCCCGWEEQDPAMDQLYTGSDDDDDTLQFSVICIPIFAITVSTC